MAQNLRGRGPVRLRPQGNVDLPAASTTQEASVAQIPVYINNRNRLTSTKALVEWLLRAGTKRVIIIDNASTYVPLLEYYGLLPEEVKVRSQDNLGPWSFWDTNSYKEQSTPYVVTDSDTVPSECCPTDLIEKLLSVLNSYPECGKVGPNLRLDNIPDLSRDFITNGDGKGWVGEGVFWKNRHPSGAFNAPIDTTFALYRAYSPWVPADWNNLRMDMPYVVEHTPWYISKPFSEEEKYYRDHLENSWSHCTWPSPINDAKD